MMATSLLDLQESIKDRSAFGALDDYYTITVAFLELLEESPPTRIIAPNDHRYIFYQYSKTFDHKITRLLNTELYSKTVEEFQLAYEKLDVFLTDLRRNGGAAISKKSVQEYLQSNAVNKVVYTIQQSIGSIGDSFDNPNQSRKRVGQLFETLVKLLIQEVGLVCESRTVTIPIPDQPDFTMKYELDLVFSNKGAILTNESEFIHPNEIIGSVKTTSKDRIDKVFLDKFLLTKLLGRDIKVIAIFLHDVQRARRANSIFGVNSTFKTNHFLGYTMALTRLDGVYYVDPRPVMVSDPVLNQEIGDFQHFLAHDIWRL